MNRKPTYDEQCMIERKLAEELCNGEDIESYHFWHGVVSGFPQCCIDYFVNVWNRGMLDKRYRRDIPIYKDKIQTGKRRIMCPNCILKELRKF